MTTTKTMPHRAMLYYPIPPFFTTECDDIHAIRGSDHQTTVIFGVKHSLNDTVYVCLQGGDKILSFQCGEWNRTLRAENGMIAYGKEEARSLWAELIRRKWVVIPREES